ncbi:Bone morphogenetic protein 1 [Mactra antiquata]
MDDSWPKAFGQACGKSVEDDCLYVNSHLNSLGILNYGSNIDCTVQLDAGRRRGGRYKLQFKRFDIEYDHRNCSYDYLKIYDNSSDNADDGSLVGKFCGNTAPVFDNMTISQRYVTLKFHTDGSTGKKGFRLLATRTLPYPCLKDYFHCKSENRCIDGRLQCDGTVQCDDETDEQDCSFWDKLIGGLFALGVSGLVGIGFLIVFGCTGICVTICCCTCCKNRCKCISKACKKCKEKRQKKNKVDPDNEQEVKTYKSEQVPEQAKETPVDVQAKTIVAVDGNGE